MKFKIKHFEINSSWEINAGKPQKILYSLRETQQVNALILKDMDDDDDDDDVYLTTACIECRISENVVKI